MGEIFKDALKGGGIGMNPALMAATGGLSAVVGAGTGAVVGMLKGVSQNRHAKQDQQSANNLQPSLYDPQQQAFLAEINQKRKSINSGSAYAADMGDINQSQAGTDQAIVQAAGGDTAGTIQGLLATQQGAGRMKNQVFGQAGADNQFYNTFGNNLLSNISARALQLQLAEQGQKRAQWAQESQDSYANTTNAAARMGGSGINWADLFHKHEAPNFTSADFGANTPEMQGMNLNPIQSMLSPDSGLGSAPDTGADALSSILSPK